MEHRVMWSFLALIAVAGCSGIQTSFRPTDPSFVASPQQDASPRVYFFAEDVPKVPMRSVGIVDVSVPGGQEEETKLRDAAAAKGKELGCWALIRHSVFLKIQAEPNAWLDRRSGVMPVHGSGAPGGPGGGGGSGSYRRIAPQSGLQQRTESFDCVVRGDGAAPT